MEAVICKNIKKTFGDNGNKIDALRGIDLTVALGEIVMIVGPSGSGKTTLISIIAGILSFDGGECEIFQKKWREFSEDEKLKFRAREIGFVFQAFNLIPMLNCSENIAVPLLINGDLEREAFSKAEDLLGELGLKDRKNSYPRQLSVGEQQRIAIARGIVHDPRLIVCDEPTSSLDFETGKKVLEILKNLASKQKAVIVVTHDNRILSYADRIVKLEDGVIKN